MQQTCIMDNDKTYRSFDLTTICRKVKAGNPCEYCYVLQARERGIWLAKKKINKIPYKHEIKRIRQSTIDKLNSFGGLRLFSFADYEEWMDEDIKKLIGDAEARGLLLKAITKNLNFIKKYSDKVFCNFSIDLVYPIPKPVWKLDRSKVKLRCMVRNEQEADKMYDQVDILTPYHGPVLNESYRPKKVRVHCIRNFADKTCCVTHNCLTCLIKCKRPTNK